MGIKGRARWMIRQETQGPGGRRRARKARRPVRRPAASGRASFIRAGGRKAPRPLQNRRRPPGPVDPRRRRVNHPLDPRKTAAHGLAPMQKTAEGGGFSYATAPNGSLSQRTVTCEREKVESYALSALSLGISMLPMKL